jgi:cob(I)alamin adenosyltransferase
MPIYTKQGDTGKTALVTGGRISKACNSIGALGDLDELTAWLGVARLAMTRSGSAHLARVQQDLFSIGSVIAGYTPAGGVKAALVTRVELMERHIDVLTNKLPRLAQFILPNGCASSAYLHVARAVCRRCERSLVELNTHTELIPYLNRLSDYLFMLARYENQRHGVQEETVSSTLQ